MQQLKIGNQITTRESPSLGKYLREISGIRLITAEEEVQLAIRIREGDQIAIQKLTQANLRFVVSVAKQYQNSSLSLGDLINEGNLGLIRAASRFDETRGFKFISYAVWWIRQAVLHALARQTPVRLPLNRLGAMIKLSKRSSELEQKFQREPSCSELSDSLGITEREVRLATQISGKCLSLEAPFVQGDESSLLDTLASNEMTPEAGLMNESLTIEIARAMAKLTERESCVLRHYYGLSGAEKLTQEEIGEKFGLSHERVRQIREKATHKLKGITQSKRLRSYLG